MPQRELIDVPVIGETLQRLGLPISPVIRANGFVFVSSLPPFDLKTGQLISGNYEPQCEACLVALKHSLEAAGSSLDKVLTLTAHVSSARVMQAFNSVSARYFLNGFPTRTVSPIMSRGAAFNIEVDCIALA